jgi:isochorismate pyruvate lyase
MDVSEGLIWPGRDALPPKESLMNKVAICHSLEEVRENIDELDRQIVGLLAARGGYVKQAVRFKKTTDDVKAPDRVEQVIEKVLTLAAEAGAMPAVTEAVYRAMISAFIEAELADLRETQRVAAVKAAQR